MDSIATAITKVLASAASTGSPQNSGALIIRRDAGNLPPLVDPMTDRRIPDLVFSNWIPSTGPRAVIRPLSEHERALVEARAGDLRGALLPLPREHNNRAGAALAEMLGGFRSTLRVDYETALDMAESLARLLSPYPAWAIERACSLIRAGDAGLDKHYAPNDTQIVEVVRGVVRHYQRTLAVMDALLTAPVEPPSPTRQKLPATTGQAQTAKRIADGKHAQRVLADLEARKQQREAQA
jgi:hypothetical protein